MLLTRSQGPACTRIRNRNRAHSDDILSTSAGSLTCPVKPETRDHIVYQPSTTTLDRHSRPLRHTPLPMPTLRASAQYDPALNLTGGLMDLMQGPVYPLHGESHPNRPVSTPSKSSRPSKAMSRARMPRPHPARRPGCLSPGHRRSTIPCTRAIGPSLFSGSSSYSTPSSCLSPCTTAYGTASARGA